MPDLNTGTQQQRDAYQRIFDTLQQYDLTGLADWVWGGLVSGQSESAMQVDLFNQDAFKQRFWVIDARRQAGLPPVSAGDVLAYEESWKQLTRQAGLPDSFTNRDYAQGQLLKDRSISEASQDVDRVYVDVHNAPPQVRAAWNTWFGANTDSALASFIFDADTALPDLERMVAEAESGGAAQQHGFAIDQAMAERLARMGVRYDQAQQGFTTLEEQRHLFDPTISEVSPLTTDIGVEAQFGMEPGAAEKVRRAADQRRADYSGGGAAQTVETGIVGAGQARSV